MSSPWSAIIPYTTAAAATIANVLAGTAVEYIGKATTMTIYGSADAAGDVFNLTGFGGDSPGMAIVPAGSPVQVASTVGSVKTNENFIGMFPIPAGTRLVLSVITSAAHTGRFLFALA
jgi:hypothetical protein